MTDIRPSPAPAGRIAPRPEDLGKFRPQLVSLARARLFNPAHAEDAVQETLLAAIEGLGSFSGGASLLGWLKGILRHKIVDCVRRSARDQWQELDGDGAPVHAGCVESATGSFWAGSVPDVPEAALSRRRLLEALERVMRELPERTAQAFVLREIGGMSIAEICSGLSVTETHCSVMVHRARIRIRERLDADWARP